MNLLQRRVPSLLSLRKKAQALLSAQCLRTNASGYVCRIWACGFVIWGVVGTVAAVKIIYALAVSLGDF